MDRCPRCGSKNLSIVMEVPWSTDGLFSSGKIYVECNDCGYRFYLEK